MSGGLSVIRWIVLVLLLAGLAACGDDSDKTESQDSETEQPETQPAGSAPDGTLSPVLVSLQGKYESLRAAHDIISDIWETLADGGAAQCGNYPTVPDPAGISAGDEAGYTDLADLLRRAAIATQEAIDQWQAECTKPRANPSPDVIGDGLLAARAAGDALAQAEILLADIQG